MVYIAHVTDKKNFDKMKEDGYTCRDYFSKHPIGQTCTTFSYPLNGVDRQLEFRPRNARMCGEDIDDEIYFIFDVDGCNCKVGDMGLEANEKEYRENMMPFSKYQESELNRKRFRDPEVVCYGSISPEKIIAILSHSEMKEIFENCPNSDKTECMMEAIMRVKN